MAIRTSLTLFNPFALDVFSGHGPLPLLHLRDNGTISFLKFAGNDNRRMIAFSQEQTTIKRDFGMPGAFCTS
jgi:hypothetical protein